MARSKIYGIIIVPGERDYTFLKGSELLFLIDNVSRPRLEETHFTIFWCQYENDGKRNVLRRVHGRIGYELRTHDYTLDFKQVKISGLVVQNRLQEESGIRERLIRECAARFKKEDIVLVEPVGPEAVEIRELFLKMNLAKAHGTTFLRLNHR